MSQGIPLLGLAELAACIQADRPLAEQIAYRKKLTVWYHRGHLPAPTAVLAQGPVWMWTPELAAWVAAAQAADGKAPTVGPIGRPRKVVSPPTDTVLSHRLPIARGTPGGEPAGKDGTDVER